VVAEFNGKVRFAVQDFGASPLAERFGIDKYPAVFVDDALVARPEDFYKWNGPGDGKYIPWKDLDSRKRFQADLRKLLEVRLAGGTLESKDAPVQRAKGPDLPSVPMQDLSGKTFTFAQLKGKPTVVEIWATWCPLCLETFSWLKKIDTDHVNLISVAVESSRSDVDKVIAQYRPAGRIVMASEELIEALGNVPAIPRTIIADANGNVVKTFYGAPPDLREQVTKEIARLR